MVNEKIALTPYGFVAHNPVMSKSEAARRLKALRERTGLSVREVAKAIDRPASSYAWYEDGYKKRYLPPDLVREIAPLFRTHGIEPGAVLELGGLSDLSADSASPKAPDHPPAYNGTLNAGIIPISNEEYASIARFDAALSAGPGSLLAEDPEPLGYHLVELQWLRAVTQSAPDHLAVVQVKGDSMEPTLSDKDWVLVDTGDKRITDQGVFAIRVGESVWVKRIQVMLSTQSVRLISDNNRYYPEDVAEDDISPIGRVIAIVARRM